MNLKSNKERFFAAYEELSSRLFRHCYLRVYNREVAKDLVQETFMRTWRYIAGGGKIDNLRAFLYRSANNLIIEQARKKKEYSLDVLQEKGFEPATQEHSRLSRFIDGKEAVSMLDKIQSPYKEVIIMRFLDELTPKEISRILNESENVISVRINRGLKKLRTLLA